MRQTRRRIPIRDLRTYGGSRAVRLPDCDYAGAVDIHSSLCADRDTPFSNNAIAAMVCQSIEFYCGRLHYTLYGYCLMPDHLHVILSPGESGTALSHWFDVFKSYTTHEFMKAGGRPPLWQRSWNDHVCRAAETAETALAYIVNNPVRAGLVNEWQDWPWTRVFIDV